MLSLTHMAEHSHRSARSIAASIRRCPGRRSALLRMGIGGGQRTAQACRDRCLGGRGHHQLHYPTLQRRLHLSGLRGRGALIGSLWLDLFRQGLSHAQEIP